MESDSKSSSAKRVTEALTQATRLGMVADRPSQQRCGRWLSRMAMGSKVDLRTNATKSKPYAVIKAEFDKVYQAAANAKLSPDVLRDVFWDELEASNRDKMGPKSMCLGFYQDGPAKLQAVLSNKPIPKGLDRQALDRAIERIASEVPARSIVCEDTTRVLERERSASEEHSIDAAGLDSTTNSGSPFYKTRFKPNALMSKSEREYTQLVFDYIKRRSIACRSALRRGETVTFDVMVGQRLVNRGEDPLSDDKVKRLIMAVEKSEAVLWKTFTPQLQDALKKVKATSGVPLHVAWEDAPVIDRAMQQHMQWCESKGLPTLSGDVSAFDASVIPDVWQRLADGCSVWFNHKDDARFFSSLNASIIGHCRVLSPLGVQMSGKSSIKSGSGGTNLIDSLYNRLAMYYGEEVGLFKVGSASVQGDDFILAGEGVTPESVSTAYSCLGLTVHPDKQNYSKGRLNFLQRLHLLGSLGGIASIYRVLNSCLVYEKLLYSSADWNPKLEAIQIISKLENAAFNPIFDELVNYVAELDKFKLFRNLPAGQIIREAGSLAGDVLSRDTAASISTRTMEADMDGFSRTATNGVLRGERLPPVGSLARFNRVYGDKRINK